MFLRDWVVVFLVLDVKAV
uniref:Uncharacterized protein n=1 Tax=Arundo donax TaxID=35708 RepID=A0A0A9BMM0_ARUDO